MIMFNYFKIIMCKKVIIYRLSWAKYVITLC